MRFAALLSLLFTGCTAAHVVQVHSDPEGAHIHLNGEWIGRTPLQYHFDSPLAERVWPRTARVVASLPGHTEETRNFNTASKLPGRIMFVLDPLPSDPWRGRKIQRETIELDYQNGKVTTGRVIVEYQDDEGTGTVEREILPPH